MNDNSGKQNIADEEVDLGTLLNGFQNFIKSLLKLVIDAIQFLFDKKFYILGIVLIGGVLGYLWDNNSQKSLKSEFIISTNFDSADFLYNKVEAISQKITQKDSTYLLEVFGEHFDLVQEIELEPIVKIYDLVAEDETNAQVFELLAEDADMAEFLKDPVNLYNRNIITPR